MTDPESWWRMSQTSLNKFGSDLLRISREIGDFIHILAGPRVSRPTRSAKVLIEKFVWNHSCNDPESRWRMSQTSLYENLIEYVTNIDENSMILFSLYQTRATLDLRSSQSLWKNFTRNRLILNLFYVLMLFLIKSSFCRSLTTENSISNYFTNPLSS